MGHPEAGECTIRPGAPILAEVPAGPAVLLATALRLETAPTRSLGSEVILGMLLDQLARRSTARRCEPAARLGPASPPRATCRWRRAQSIVHEEASSLRAPHSA